LKQAVELAQVNYPAVSASLAKIAEADSKIELARAAYLPKTDIYLQTNLASRNNVFGLIFPNSAIPPISGPVIDDATFGGTLGSAAGFLFSWEPFDLGLREADIELANAQRQREEDSLRVTRHEVSVAVVDSFFRALSAQIAKEAAQANLDRVDVFSKTVEALVRAELRPGADASRVQTEKSHARTELLAIERTERESLVILAGWLGLAGHQLEIDGSRLLEEAPAAPAPVANISTHPFVRERQADIEVAQARLRSIENSYYPKFEVLSAVYGRGSGANLDGTFEGGLHGLIPSTGNWAVGFSVKFPLFEYTKNRIRREIAAQSERTEGARLKIALEEVKTEVARAEVQLSTAREIAKETPIALEAARTLQNQAEARYRTGLATVLEVAEAQRTLRQAEIDNALAQLGIWRTLFAVAAASGEMEDLLDASN
jgi:outer membrane protein TolC